MKKKLQIILSTLMFIFTLAGFSVYTYLVYHYLVNELTFQVMKNNELLGEKMADFLIENGIERLPEKERREKLQHICDEIELPNGGYACASGLEGDLLAMTGGLPEEKVNFHKSEIRNKAGKKIGFVKDIPKNNRFRGFFKRDKKGRDIIASVALEKSNIRLFVHQDEKMIQNKAMKTVEPLIFLALGITLILSLFMFYSSDFIVKKFRSRIEKINQNLEITNIKLEKINQKRRQLVHILSHDLANPLSAVRMTVQLLEQKPNLVKKFISRIGESTEQAVGIIDVVRKMEAIETGKFKLELNPIKLKEIIESSYKTLQRRFEKKNIMLNIEMEADIAIWAEQVSLQNSVINNIFTNAIKFSPESGEIDVKAYESGKNVILTVRDYGIGMPEKLLENVFEINKKTSRPGTNGEQGTGFGMPLIKKFVEEYGAEISITSKEEKDVPEDHGTIISIAFRKADFS